MKGRGKKFVFKGGEYAVFAVEASPAPKAAAPLTEAEEAVLALVLEGHSNAEIAKRRNVAVRTIANQLQSLFKKKGVRSRAELTALLSPR